MMINNNQANSEVMHGPSLDKPLGNELKLREWRGRLGLLLYIVNCEAREPDHVERVPEISDEEFEAMCRRAMAKNAAGTSGQPD